MVARSTNLAAFIATWVLLVVIGPPNHVGCGSCLYPWRVKVPNFRAIFFLRILNFKVWSYWHVLICDWGNTGLHDVQVHDDLSYCGHCVLIGNLRLNQGSIVWKLCELVLVAVWIWGLTRHINLNLTWKIISLFKANTLNARILLLFYRFILFFDGTLCLALLVVGDRVWLLHFWQIAKSDPALSIFDPDQLFANLFFSVTSSFNYFPELLKLLKVDGAILVQIDRFEKRHRWLFAKRELVDGPVLDGLLFVDRLGVVHIERVKCSVHLLHRFRGKFLNWLKSVITYTGCFRLRRETSLTHLIKLLTKYIS